MASPARSDETWSLVATTTELVAMAPLPLGEAMTALLASLLGGIDWERETLGPSQVSQPGTELSQLIPERSEEHTSELQSRPHLVCRLLLEKKKMEEMYVDRLKAAHDPRAYH